jgi:G3E family GTPase
MLVPVTVLGGYLGAGKTTLVNHVLRHSGGRRIAVLINDFGALPIDADLIEGSDGGVISIAGGCVCCSYGDDLVTALQAMTTRVPAPAHILIETSGVALPDAIALKPCARVRRIAIWAIPLRGSWRRPIWWW